MIFNLTAILLKNKFVRRLRLVYARIMEQNKNPIKVFLKTGFQEIFRCLDGRSGSEIIVKAMINSH